MTTEENCKKNMASSPLVSIILPTRNRAQLLPYSLKSVLNQSYKNIEIVIVDDHSTDRTSEILANFAKEDKRIKVIRNRKKQGLPKSRNIGLTYSRGSLVFFSEDDLILSNYAIEVLINTYLEYEAEVNLGGVAPRVVSLSRQRVYTPFPECDIIIVGLFNIITGEPHFCYDVPRTNIAIALHPPATSLFPRRLFNVIGAYYTGYKHNYIREESDLFMRALKNKFIFLYQPKAIVYHLSGFKGGCTIENALLNEIAGMHNHAVFLLRNYGIKTFLMLSSYLLKKILKIKYLTKPKDASENPAFIERIGYRASIFETIRNYYRLLNEFVN